MHISPDRAELAEAIVTVGRRLYESNLVCGCGGSLSVRLGVNAVLCTPSGVCKGTLTPDNLVVVNLNGAVVEGSLPASSEIKMHLAAYAADESIRAVCHAHPIYASTLACARLTPPPSVLIEAELVLGAVPLCRYAPPSSAELAQGVGDVCARANACLLERHGAVSWGGDLTQALWRMETLERVCNVFFNLQLLNSGETTVKRLTSA